MKCGGDDDVDDGGQGLVVMLAVALDRLLPHDGDAGARRHLEQGARRQPVREQLKGERPRSAAARAARAGGFDAARQASVMSVGRSTE